MRTCTVAAAFGTLFLLSGCSGGGDGATPAPTTYVISGTIATALGAPVQGVSVTLSGPTAAVAAVTTDAAGLYSVDVPDGTYTVIPSLEGYKFVPPYSHVVVSGGSRTQGFTSHLVGTVALYDPLSATTLDAMLWQTPQYFRSISGGKAVLAVQADHMQPRLAHGVVYGGGIGVPSGPNRVTSLQADVRVPTGSLARTGTAIAVGGIRLSYQPAADRKPLPPASMNTLHATLDLYDDGGGLRIRRRFYHCDDAECRNLSGTGISVVDPGGFAVSGVNASAQAAYDTTYRFGLELDEDTGVFTWTVEGGTFGTPGVSGTGNATTWASGVGMVINSTSNGFSGAGLVVRTSDEVGGGDGRIAAEFDDVWVGLNGGTAALYDDFATMGSSDATGFSQARWGAVNGGVALSGGSLHLRGDLTTSGTGGGKHSITISPMFPETFDGWQADFVVTAEGGYVRFGGAFYNDGTPGSGPNNATGDIRAAVNLGAGFASYWFGRCTNAACSSFTNLGNVALSPSIDHPLDPGTVHTLFERWNPGTGTFTFRLDNADPVEVPAPTTVVSPTPFVPGKFIHVYLEIPSGAPAGTSGSSDVSVSNVHVAW